MKPIYWHCLTSLFLVMLVGSSTAMADDTAVIEEKLQRFLAGVSAGDLSVHEWFWADDLVYTSSSGSRFGKAEILAPMDDNEGDSADAGASPAYSAEAVDIRLYGDAAVLVFTLVSLAPAEGDAEPVVTRYLNTGTLLKRAGEWSVVAWQATRVPEPAAP